MKEGLRCFLTIWVSWLNWDSVVGINEEDEEESGAGSSGGAGGGAVG